MGQEELFVYKNIFVFFANMFYSWKNDIEKLHVLPFQNKVLTLHTRILRQ